MSIHGSLLYMCIGRNRIHKLEEIRYKYKEIGEEREFDREDLAQKEKRDYGEQKI